MWKNRIFAILLTVFLLTACTQNDLIIDTGETASLLEPSVTVGTMTVKETETETAPPETVTETAAETIAETVAETEATVTATAETSARVTYILNTNSKKIHYSTCSSVRQIKDENRQETAKTMSELLAEGYTACGRCKPK